MFRCVYPHTQTLWLSKMFKWADDWLVWNLKNQQLMLEDTWSPAPPFCGKESLGETTWYPVQSCLDHLQWWRLYHILRGVLLVTDCSDYNKIPKKPKLNQTKKPPPTNLSSIKMEPCQKQLVPVAPCLLFVCSLCEERASVHSVDTI